MAALHLADIDPEADEWGDDAFADIDYASAGDELMVRMMRKLRFVRHDLADKEAMFAREQERLQRAAERVCKPLADQCASIEKALTDWLAFKQRRQVDAGTDPAKVKKSLPLPDGTIKSRMSTKVDTVDGCEVIDLPVPYRRAQWSIARDAIKAAVKAGDLKVGPDGRLVTGDGEILDVELVESVSYSVATEAV